MSYTPDSPMVQDAQGFDLQERLKAGYMSGGMLIHYDICGCCGQNRTRHMEKWGWTCQQCSHGKHPSDYCNGTRGQSSEYHWQVMESRRKWSEIAEDQRRKK